MTDTEFKTFVRKYKLSYKPCIRIGVNGYICIGQYKYGIGKSPQYAYAHWKEAVQHAHTS